MHLVHVHFKVVEPHIKLVNTQLSLKFLPNFFLYLLQPFIDVSFQNELFLILVRLVDFTLKSDNLSLQRKGGTLTLQVHELIYRSIVLELLLYNIEIFFHGCVTCCHFYYLYVIT